MRMSKDKSTILHTKAHNQVPSPISEEPHTLQSSPQPYDRIMTHNSTECYNQEDNGRMLSKRVDSSTISVNNKSNNN